MSESAINRSLLNESTVSRLPIERAIKESVHEDYPNEAESVMNKAPLIQLLCFEGLAMFIFMFGFSCYTSRSE